ncbi:hypothetical protein [Streptomyces sp. NBC_00273]|uniref:hypothetical protein n=1 Tax=Streptomyces sp. NBC_00273 TaxID=2903644 RepID=UPI002E27D254|nr:hypothetical protein [Streptomyces sp. NBC_00273]
MTTAHTFRLLKQTLGWTRPELREPDAADRRTSLITAAHPQRLLARPLTRDLRPPEALRPHAPPVVRAPVIAHGQSGPDGQCAEGVRPLRAVSTDPIDSPDGPSKGRVGRAGLAAP